MGRYTALEVPQVINAGASQTVLGGSLMPPEVIEAMSEAARSFISLPELHDRVGERIAMLTGNEAACVCCGAAAGMLVTTAACIAGTNADWARQLPDTTGIERTELVVFRNHVNGFLSTVPQAGGKVIAIDGTAEALEEALGERTAAVMWFEGPMWGDGALPLAETIEIAHAKNVPVIVDAADQIPPLSNLWRYTREMSADLAIFSGGKGLRGPQASGIIVGRADLIAACRLNGGPYHGVGRPAKVGKEEIVGLLAALELALSKDERDEAAVWSRMVNHWIDGLRDVPGITVERVERSHSGQPIPRAIIRVHDGTRDAVIKSLWERNPRVAILPEGDDALGLNPHHLSLGEEEIVLQALREVLSQTMNVSGITRPT